MKVRQCFTLVLVTTAQCNATEQSQTYLDSFNYIYIHMCLYVYIYLYRHKQVLAILEAVHFFVQCKGRVLFCFGMYLKYVLYKQIYIFTFTSIFKLTYAFLFFFKQYQVHFDRKQYCGAGDVRQLRFEGVYFFLTMYIVYMFIYVFFTIWLFRLSWGRNQHWRYYEVSFFVFVYILYNDELQTVIQSYIMGVFGRQQFFNKGRNEVLMNQDEQKQVIKGTIYIPNYQH
eukprot:TRINITY_DN4602_c1_g1_i3.p2 TRINITY_DN4602_c1_g1~~TRINITY_DN4602_c1_g1_i3.p2  ORF type:complete len:228 (+),score=-11.17 TRINITY_DN4602_c1_g1_i3:197-880(+)